MIIIDANLALGRSVHWAPLEGRPFELPVRMAELNAAQVRFGAPDTDNDRWTFETPDGRLDLLRISASEGMIVSDGALPVLWVFKVLFGSPSAFATRTLARLGTLGVAVAYEAYLAYRAEECDDPATAEMLEAMALEMRELLQRPLAQLFTEIPKHVDELRLARRALMAAYPALTNELFDDHLTTLIAIAQSADDPAAQPQDRGIVGMLDLHLRHLPAGERDLLDDVPGHKFRHHQGVVIYIPEFVPDEKFEDEFPELWTLIEHAYELGCRWLSIDEDGRLLAELPLFV